MDLQDLDNQQHAERSLAAKGGTPSPSPQEREIFMSFPLIEPPQFMQMGLRRQVNGEEVPLRPSRRGV